MAYDVVIKTVPTQWIASVRETIPAYNTVGSLYPKVTAGLDSSLASCLMGVALWHDFEYTESDVDAEAGFYLKQRVPATDGVRVYELPETTVASTIHNGAYGRLPKAYDPLPRWVTDESYVTEIQVPVSKG